MFLPPTGQRGASDLVPTPRRSHKTEAPPFQQAKDGSKQHVHMWHWEGDRRTYSAGVANMRSETTDIANAHNQFKISYARMCTSSS